LNVTELFPCALPKCAPAIVIGVVQDAELQLKPVVRGGGTVKGSS
jgi:hypothetical protein